MRSHLCKPVQLTKRSKKKSDHPYISPPDGVTVLPPVTTGQPEEAVQQQFKKNPLVRPGSQTKIPEKISGPVSEEQRKTNMELFSKMGIPSIASLKQKEEKIIEAEIGAKPIIGLRENSFDDPAFRNAWDNICLRIKEMGKDSLLTTLTRYPPVVDFSSYVIKLTIDNKVQEQDLSREKPWILEMIRDILSNDKVNFEIEHTVVNATSQPYTPREKFMKMAEKNPDLIYLAEKLKLDL